MYRRVEVYSPIGSRPSLTVSNEEQTVREPRWSRTGSHPDYHAPADDADRIDFGKLTRVARLAARAAWIVADGPEPTFKKR